MTARAGDAGAKAASRVHEANRARAKRTKALRDSWVLDGEMTAEQLIAKRDQMRAECMARHPSWFGVTG